MINLKTGKKFDSPSAREQMTRREFGKGLAAIIGAGVAPSIALGTVSLAGSANATVGRGMMRNVGARNAAMFGGGKPYDEELVYLESNGYQYIDTGVYTAFTGAYWIRAKYAVKTDAYAFTGGDGGFLLGVTDGKVFNTSIPVVVGRFYDVICSNNGEGRVFYVDGVQNGTASNYRQVNKIYIFGFTTRSSSTCNYYPFMIQSNSIYIDGLVRDYIAVLKNGIPCMYDKIGDRFYYNKNSGHQFGYKRYGRDPVAPY